MPKEPIFEGEALAAKVRSQPNWSVANGFLTREYKTDGWKSTMFLVNAIAYFAEAADHHPDLEVHWGSLVVRLQTHSAGGITAKDFLLAAQIEATAAWHPE